MDTHPKNIPAAPPGPESIGAETASGQASGQKRPKKALKKITETYLSNAGAYYLQRHAASSARFRTIMSRKIDQSCRHHPEQNRDECYRLLDRIVARFQELGYLNDNSYARMKVQALFARGVSRRMVAMKLQHAGIPEHQIATALEDHARDTGNTAEETEMNAALKLARKKHVGPYAGEIPYDRNKAIAAFARAGFSFDIIRKVLNLSPEDIAQDF